MFCVRAPRPAGCDESRRGALCESDPCEASFPTVSSIEAGSQRPDLPELLEKGLEFVWRIVPLDILRNSKQFTLFRRHVRSEVRKKTAPNAYRLPNVEDFASWPDEAVDPRSVFGPQTDPLAQSLWG